MRIFLGILILFLLIFGGYWPVSLSAFALFVSALIGCFQPENKIGLPGYMVAMALGTLTLLILVVAGVNDFFDGDC